MINATDEQAIRELRWQMAECRTERQRLQDDNARLVSLLGHAETAICAEYRLRVDSTGEPK